MIDVLANDNDGPDTGETLTVTVVGNPPNGTAAIITTPGPDFGKVSYTPDADFFGTDTFTYTISDGNGGTDTATVTVTVTNVNDDPVANDDSATVAEDTLDNVIDVLANDNDGPDTGETLTVTAVSNPPTARPRSSPRRAPTSARSATRPTPTSSAPTRSPTRSATATAGPTRPPSP